MAAEDFVQGLISLGYSVTGWDGRVVVFRYPIPVGPRRGEGVDLAFAVPPDFPLQCPTGPHVRPALFPLNGGGEHPSGAIHAARDGVPSEFQYWSRPFPGWAESDRSTRSYLSHIHHLFDTL